MSLESSPSESQWTVMLGSAAARSFISGEVSSLMAATTTLRSVGARGVEQEEREAAVAGDEAEGLHSPLTVRHVRARQRASAMVDASGWVNRCMILKRRNIL